MASKSRTSTVAASETKSPEAPAVTPAGLDRGDVSLVRWMLSLTPIERLEAAQDFADSMTELRNAREITH